jgi:hypothetical protein
MEDAPRTPVAGVVITVLVLIVGAYLLDPDDEPGGRSADTDPSERTETTVYPGEPSLPDPGGGPLPGVPVTDDTFVVIEPDDGPN